MAEIDPSKVVVVFEYLFGPKLGRWVAQALLALITLALITWLLHVCWEYGGKSLYASLSILSAKFPTFDSIQAVLLTMMFILIVYSVVLLGVVVFFVQKVFRTNVPQSVLDELAILRSKAIHEILNAKVNSDGDFDSWTKTDKAWMEEVLNILKKYFPKAEELGFERLGVIQPVEFSHAFNHEHGMKLMFFAKRLGILEDIIRRYSR